MAFDASFWQKLAWLALAGSLGTLARYGLGGLVQRFAPASFPWGTLVINLLGCLLFGFVWALAENRMIISTQTRLILLTGFMGAFTTFSSFAFETSQLLDDSQWLWAAGNLLAQNICGIVLVFVGIALGRLV